MIPPFHTSERAGFTLVETLVAVTIIMLAVAGPLYSANRALVAAEIARDQLSASYLAQEGVEYMRVMRDNEFLALSSGDTGSAWSNFLTKINPCVATVVGSGPACTLDPASPFGVGSGLSLQTCTMGSCAPLSLRNNGTTNVYTESASLGSPATGVGGASFTRTIQAVAVSPGPDEKIVSKVSWNFHGTIYSVTVIDHLTPWQ